MKYKGMIFDLDGTLLDSLKGIADASNRLMEKYGYPTFEVDRYKDFVGQGIRELINYILPPNRRKSHDPDQLEEEYKAFYQLVWRKGSPPYKGIPEALTKLQSQGIKLAILSNKTDSTVKLMVDELLAKFTFHPIIGNLSEETRKPNPINALKIADEMGLNPREILFVGDTKTDMQTAVNAGMIGVGVLWGFRTEEELVSNGATNIITKPGMLLEMIDKRV